LTSPLAASRELFTAGRAVRSAGTRSSKGRSRNTGVNQHGDPVISFISSSFVERRDKGREPA
jgi:hypothetical protein